MAAELKNDIKYLIKPDYQRHLDREGPKKFYRNIDTSYVGSHETFVKLNCLTF